MAWGLVAAVVLLGAVVVQAALAVDIDVPTVPTGVTATPGATAPIVASISWSAASDNVGVVGYHVARAVHIGGPYELVGTTPGSSFADTTAVPAQPYFYSVSAFDAAGNESAQSAPAGPVRSKWVVSPHAAADSQTAYCSWCHTLHSAASSGLMRDTGSNPSGQVSICARCHDGSTTAANVMTSTVDSFALASGHTLEDTTTAPDLANDCASCHSVHRDSAANPRLPRLTVNGATVATEAAAGGAPGLSWCEACHDNSQSWYGPGYPSSATPVRAADGYPTVGTFPGPLTYNSPATNAHASIPASQTAFRAKGSCLYCHAAHRGANSRDGLKETYRPATAATLIADQSLGTYAASCFVCHGGVLPSVLTTLPTNIKQYVTGGRAQSGHRIITPGGTLPVGAPLPCYDCHNPHGSSRGNGSLISDELGRNLNTSTDSDTRRFCLSCHSSSDGAVWDSVGSAYVAVSATARVEGIPRNAGALALPPVSGHDSADARSCELCHGADYSAGGSNVHSPSAGASSGGSDCYSCHGTFQTYMEDGAGPKTGASRATVYHHVLGGTLDTTYYDGDKAFDPGAYPSSTGDVFCLSCHVDHDRFNSSKAGNLRSGLSTDEAASTDYSTTTDTGICTDCHGSSRAKQGLGTDQKDDGSTATPKIVAGAGANQFGASAHNYTATSVFGDSSTFAANCSKCHNDEDTPQYKRFQTSLFRFGPHWSAERRLLSALGGSLVDPLGAQSCYRCHSGGTGGNDYYGGAPMAQGSRSVGEEFALLSTHPVVAAGGSAVQCVNCHNPHTANSGAGKVSDPSNTYSSVAYGTEAEKTSFCLKCHSSASLPIATVNDTTYVPATVSIAPADQALMDKSTFGARGHWSASGSISAGEVKSCAACHAQHGSSNPRLLGEYDAASATNRINGVVISANDNGVCAACHTGASTAYPSTIRDANDYPANGTYPGPAVYSGANGIHRGANVIWPGATYAGGDCKNCHDVHGTVNQHDELRSPDTNQSFAVGTATLCFTCHDSNGPASADIQQFFPTDVGGAATQSADTRFGHKTESAGSLPAGSALPCYDCHNPHGSANAAGGLLVATMTDSSTHLVLGDDAGEIDMSSAPGVRAFCFACHTTAGASSPDTTAYGWAGTGYQVVSGGALLEGIDRTVYDSTNKRGLKLPPVSGHYRDDSQACYTCHGNSYGAGGSNVHNPSAGLSNGGTACYSCHSEFKQTMDAAGTSKSASYHHVLGTSSVTYTGDLAPGAGAYPTSQTDVYCVSCHTDHNYFNSDKGANLRSSVSNASGAANTNTDYSTTGSYGICVSCHVVAQVKQGQGTDQGALGAGATPVIPGSEFATSAHQYTVASAFGASAFNANCSKCHSDEQTKRFQTSTYKFGTHWSESVGILRALGVYVANPPKEEACYKCHNSTGAAYGENLSAAAKATQSEFARISSHDLTKVACVNCHNVHEASASSPAADPDNTYLVSSQSTSAEKTAFCLKCHDGTTPGQIVDGTTLIPYTVNAGASADVHTYYSSDGHGGAEPGPLFSGRASTGYATSYTDVSANWVNDASVLGAPDTVSATSSSNNSFELQTGFTFPTPTRLDSIDSATLTVRSQAAGGWGAQVGSTAASQTIYPSSTVANGSWAIAGSTPAASRQASIDDPWNAPDDAVTYINGTGTTEYQAGVAAPSIPANATNISVSVVWRGRDGTTNTNTVWSRIRYNGAYSNAGTTNRNPTTTWATYTDTWTTAPGGAAWTPANVALVTGLGIDASGTGPNWITQMYIRVDYQVPKYNDDTWAIQYTTNGLTWNDMVMANTSTEAGLTDHTINLTGILTTANYQNFRVRVFGAPTGAADNAGSINWDSATVQVTYSGADAGPARAGCRDCHTQHGSTLPHLLNTTVDGQAVSSYGDAADEAQCLACHRAGTTTGASDISRYYPASAGGTADASMSRSGHRTKAGAALPCRQCHNPHGGAGSGYMLEVRTQVIPGIDTLIGAAPGELAMSDANQTPANAVAVRRFCLTCHTDSATGFGWNGSADAAVLSGCTVLGMDRTSGALRLPTLPTGIPGHRLTDTSWSCYVCHGDDFTSSASVNVHNPAAGESRGNIPCYTCHTVYQTKMDVTGAARTDSYHHVLGSGTRNGDSTIYPVNTDPQTDMYCLSCHVDHDLFSPLVSSTLQRGSNLRRTIFSSEPLTTAEATNTDFVGGVGGTQSSSTVYATTFTPTVGTWTTGANSTGAPNGTVATSPSNNTFDGRHAFTFPANMSSVTNASITVRSQATGFAGVTGPTSTPYYPTGDGATNNWSASTGTNKWAVVDDTNTTDWIYLTQGQTNVVQLFTAARSIPANATNITVSVAYTAQCFTAGTTNNMTARMTVGGTTYTHGTIDNVNTTAWTGYTHAWTTNPNTGAAWTAAQVNGTAASGNLTAFGVSSGATVSSSNGGAPASALRATTVQLVVGYTVASTQDDTWAIQYTTNGSTWSDITAANVLNEAGLTDHTLDLTGVLSAANAPNFRVRVLGTPTGAADNAGTVAWDASTLTLTYVTSDGTGGNGVCLACHSSVLAKDSTNQKSYAPSTVTPSIAAADYDGSAHDYRAQSTFSDSSTFNANCAKCHDSQIDGGGMEGGKSTSGFQTSSNKFSVHYSSARRILAAMGVPTTDPLNEERECYACHSLQSDGLKSTSNQDWYARAAMSASSQQLLGLSKLAFHHGSSDYAGLHPTAWQDETRSYLSANKHVECADCHDVHIAQPTRHTPGIVTGNQVSGALRGVPGAQATFAATAWTSPTAYSQVTSSTYEYQICFKCHSGYNTNTVADGQTTIITWGGTGAGRWTDQGLEFSPANQSFHPVVAALNSAGSGSSVLPTGDLRPAFTGPDGATYGGWAPGDTMYCSDCHAQSNAGSLGPHGSSVKWMLKGPNQAWPYTTATSNGTSTGTYRMYSTRDTNLDTADGLFCRNCHVLNGTEHSEGNHNVSPGCVMCHIRVPHGGKVSRLIRSGPNANIPPRYMPDGNGGTAGSAVVINQFLKSAGTYSTSNCQVTGCSSHGAITGESW